MGWRVGYIAYPKFGGDPSIEQELIKVQDSIAICSSQLGQHLAHACLTVGSDWVRQHVRSIEGNVSVRPHAHTRVTLGHRQAVLEALTPLGKMGDGIYGGDGALYIWVRLPDGFEDDDRVVRWLVQNHGVCVIPGTSCGLPGLPIHASSDYLACIFFLQGYMRIAFANQPYEKCQLACGRLKAGLNELVTKGPSVMRLLST